MLWSPKARLPLVLGGGVLMVAIVLAFPQIVGKAPLAVSGESVEIPTPADPNAGYLLPPDRH